MLIIFFTLLYKPIAYQIHPLMVGEESNFRVPQLATIKSNQLQRIGNGI